MSTINSKEINDKIASLPSRDQLSKEQQRQEDIAAINDYALRNPDKVFNDDFREQRKHLSEETWKSVIQANPDMQDSASPKWRHIPNADIVNKYQGQAFSGEVRKAINEDGVKVAVGALAIPTVIAGGVPFLETVGNSAINAGAKLYYKPVQTLTNFGAGLAGGITGSLYTDAIVDATTDYNNFGQWFNYKTGLPETVGNFLNPGGLILGGLAAGVTNKALAPWASNLDRSIVFSRMFKNGVKNIDLNKVYKPNLTSKYRFKLGDVEINDPNLYYRQVGSKIAREFPKTGRQIPTLKEVGYGDSLESVHNRSLKFKLGKVPFENPMYAEGSLWYGISQKGNIDGLLTTNTPMRWATKSSKPTAYGPIKTSEDGLVTTVRTGFDVGNVGSRRIPYEGTITPQNTTAYEFIPGYGYRKIQIHPQKVSYKFYERPSTLTEAERLGIPKGERNKLFKFI